MIPCRFERKSRNRKGDVTGGCEQQTIGGKETSLHHRSVKCKGLLSISSKSGMCCNCKLVRCSWNKYLNDPSLVTNNEKIQTKRKREDLMDKEELLLTLQEEKRLKRNAPRREAYLRGKNQCGDARI